MTPEETETKLLISLLESCTKAGTAHRTNVIINGERYTLIDCRAQWRKKFDRESGKA